MPTAMCIRASGRMARLMAKALSAIIMEACTPESGETTCNTGEVSSSGTLIASDMRETSSKVKRQARENSNSRDPLMKAILSKANSMAMESITLQTVEKYM